MKMLANEAKQIDVKKTDAERREKQKRIADIIERLETIKDELQSIAKSNLSKVTFRGRDWMPMDLAREVTELKKLYEWFPDRPEGSLSDPCPISTSDMMRLGELRNFLGKDIIYPVEGLPEPALLPTLGVIISAHEELTIGTRGDNEIQSGKVPLMALTKESDISDARELLVFLKSIDALSRVRSQSEWFSAFANVALRHINEGNSIAEKILSLISDWIGLGKKGEEFVARRVDVGAHPKDEELTAAVDALCIGKNPYGFVPIGKSGLKAKVGQIFIEGRPPKNKDDWVVIKNCRGWLIEVDTYLVAWRACGAEAKLPPHHESLSKAAPFMVLKTDEMAISHRVFANIARYKEIAKRLAPYGFDWTEIFDNGKTEEFAHALAVNLARYKKDGSAQFLERLRALVRNPSLPFDAELNATISHLGDPK